MIKLTKEHKIYKVYKKMKDREKEIEEKKKEIGWAGLDGPFMEEEIENHRNFWEELKRIGREVSKERDLIFNFNDLSKLYDEDK